MDHPISLYLDQLARELQFDRKTLDELTSGKVQHFHRGPTATTDQDQTPAWIADLELSIKSREKALRRSKSPVRSA